VSKQQRLRKEVLGDALHLYLEKLYLNHCRTKIDKKRFNMALELAEIFDVDIHLDWESERKVV